MAIEKLPPWLEKIANDELHENPDSRSEDIRKLQVKLKEEGTDLWVSIDDHQFLLRFLRVSKFDLEKAFDRVMRYNRDMRNYLQNFSDIHPASFVPFFKDNIMGMIPVQTHEKPQIFYVGNLDNWDPGVWDVSVLLQGLIVIMEHFLYNPEAQIVGVYIVVDVRNFSFSHMMNVMRSPTVVFKFATLVQSVLPLRMKGLYFFKSNRFIATIISMLRACFSQKFKERLHVVSSEDRLHQLIGKENLPEDVGGSLPPFDNGEFIRKIGDWKPTWEKVDKTNFQR